MGFLNELDKMGAFVGAPVEKEIKFTLNGEEHRATVFIRALSYAAARAGMSAMVAGGEVLAARIAASVFDADGKPVFTAGDITGDADPKRGPLAEPIVKALLDAIFEVSGLGEPRATTTTTD